MQGQVPEHQRAVDPGSRGEFTDRAEAYGVADRRGRGRDNTFIDVNRDGYEDPYVGNDFPRKDRFKSKNSCSSTTAATTSTAHRAMD